MSLVSIMPPGTLFVVNGLANRTVNISMTLIDCSNINAPQEDDFSTSPSTIVVNNGMEASQSSDIVPFWGSAPNSSYFLDIKGSYIQCKPINPSEQIYFD